VGTPEYLGRQKSMQEALVEKMTDFGFTVNQAKVYLSIVQAGKTGVGRISKNTQLHRQDIYKLLPKLETMGLITRTIDKPFMIEALPVKRALESIILKEKEKSDQRIAQLEKSLKVLSETIQQQPESKEDARFTLLTTDEAILNRSEQSYKKRTKNVMIVTTIEQIKTPSINHFRAYTQIVEDGKAKLRLIIVGSEGKDEAVQIAEKVAPRKGSFKVKLIDRCACKNYQLIDDKEVWIATHQKTQAGYPSILWTNDPNIVGAYRENFNETWNSSKAVTVYRTPVAKEEKQGLLEEAVVNLIATHV
jgi:sugar-specific transcriptional regulator TrmB